MIKNTSKTKITALLLNFLIIMGCVCQRPVQENASPSFDIPATPSAQETIADEIVPDLEMITNENYAQLEIIKQIQLKELNCNFFSPTPDNQKNIASKISYVPSGYTHINLSKSYNPLTMDENTLNFSTDGKKLQIGLHVYDMTIGNVITLDEAQNVSYSPTYTRRAEYKKKVLTILNLDNGQENIYHIDIDGDYFLSGIAWDDDKPYILLNGRYESVLRMIDPITSEQILIFPDYKATPYDISFYFHENMFIVVRVHDKDLSVDAWDMDSKEKIEEFSGVFPKNYTFFAFNHSYSAIMANNVDDIYLWRYPGFAISQIIDEQFQAYPDNIVFNGDDQMVILHPYGYNLLRFWNTATGDFIGNFEFPEDTQIIRPGLAISPDGKILATNASDGTVYLWGVRK